MDTPDHYGNSQGTVEQQETYEEMLQSSGGLRVALDEQRQETKKIVNTTKKFARKTNSTITKWKVAVWLPRMDGRRRKQSKRLRQSAEEQRAAASV